MKNPEMFNRITFEMFNNLLDEIYRSCVETTNEQLQISFSWLCAAAVVARASAQDLGRIVAQGCHICIFFPTNQNLILKYLTFLKNNIYGPGGESKNG